METQGISPKVKLPAGALLALGALIFAVSFIVEGADDLGEVGLSLIAASGLVGSIGFRAGPGAVTTDVGTPSDEILAGSQDRVTVPAVEEDDVDPSEVRIEPGSPTPDDEPDPDA